MAEADAAGPGLRRTRFAETPPISTYLTALVAGDYHATTGPPMGTNQVPAAIFCRQSVLDYLDAAEIFAITAGGFEVFERRFGIGYPFAKYDQVFVPEYNSGAMENVGCVTLRDDNLFRSKVTTASLDYRRNTILHELSHMWFGNLVTMRWWDDLWLKESFATWSATFAVSEQADDPELAWAAFCAQLQDLGLPPGPAAVHPPGGGGHGRPGGRRAELRPDHLRQGRGAAGAAGVLCRPRRLPGRGAGLLHRATPSATPP